ncbi:MAG: hypothetical protein Q4D37_08620 [Oscillospiraceae bacterium]|nr:hypothetical protein [Oscillospiraceae bacterium]
MINLKKIAATAVAAATAAVCGGCNSAMAYPLTIDGVPVKAGIYIYYSYAAYSEAISTIQEQNEELDTTDDDLVKEQIIDGVDTLTWIQNKAMDYCKEYVAVQKDFEEKGLSLTKEETDDVEQYVSSAWENNGEVFEANGISEASVKDVLTSTYKSSELFLYYYNVDGEKGVTEDELKEYYIDNDARVRYIQFDLKDGNGDLLKEDGKKEMKKMVETYLDALEKLEGDEAALNEEMDSIQEEYNAYVTSISEEAAAATATSATDENGSEIPATTTTTETTTAAETTTTTTAVAESEDETVTRTALTEEDETDSTTTTISDAEETEGTTETTTTTVPYAHEVIITKVSTKEDEETDESEINYTPSKKAYEAIFDDAKIGVPMMVEDEEAYYLIIRFDIEDRMTEDDLWSEDAIESVTARKYMDTFDEDKEKMADALTVEQSDHAIKKYDPFKLDFSSNS